MKDLSVSFETEGVRTQALKKVSFQMNPNEIVALVGESGSGKSLTALSIMGLIPSPPGIITSGSIFLHQEDILHKSTKKLEEIRGNQIAMIFQEPMTSLNPLKTCGKQITESLQLHRKLRFREARNECIRLFDEVRLPAPDQLFDKYPHEISGGQKQRVMIAMAMSCSPQLLIADEPTTALDVSVQRTILNLIKELQQKNRMSVLFITHDLGLVKEFADYVIVMHKGKIIECAGTSELFNQPKNDYTKGLLACRPDPGTRVKTLIQVEDIMNNRPLNPQRISVHEFQNRMDMLSKRKNILELQDLHIWYPVRRNFFGKTTEWFKAVNGLSLSLRKGETLGIVGESGSGKTSVGKCIVGLNPIHQGEILYKGKNIRSFTRGEKADYKREVQMIFQDPYSSLNPRISIGRAIREPMDVHGILPANERKDRVMELLQRTGLKKEHYARYPHEFSGGQRQRICITRCLAMNPELIICDESVSALDVSVQAKILNLLSDLREAFDLSYIFISHDLAVVKHISDHIAVMKGGQIDEYGDAERIYHNPQKEYTRHLIHSDF